MPLSNLDTHYQLDIYDWDNTPEAVYALRRRVFVTEQKVPPELEWDETDAIADHFLVRTMSGDAVAVGRLYADDDGNGRIGRMAVARDHRGTGLGLWLLRAIMSHGGNRYARFILSAQEHAIPFYQRTGFVVCSDRYDDAGIPHRTMRCTAPGLVLNQESEITTPLLLNEDTTSWQLHSNHDWNAALDTLASQARRRLWVFEQTLGRVQYDREFLRDTLSELARRSRYSEIRLLISDDKPLAEHSHRLVDLMRRLPSHIQLHVLKNDLPAPLSSFALVDNCGVAFRHQAAAPDGFANFNAPGRVKPLARQFQHLWDMGRPSLELRELRI